MLIDATHTMIHVAIVLISAVVVQSNKGCVLPKPPTDPDWEHMHKDWYDVFNLPNGPDGAIDCYHWLNMTGASDGGFYVDLTVNVLGYPSKSYRDHFVKRRTGVYQMSGNYASEYVATVKNANEHREMDKDFEISIIADSDWLAQKEIALITDHENYLIFTMCTPWGPVSWVKFPQRPTISQVAKAWNSLADNSLMGSVEYREGCTAHFD